MSDTNQNETENEWRQRELGALWRRSGKNQKYLSGYVKIGDELNEREVRLIVFTNKYKNDNEKAPDFVIYESTPMEGAQPAAQVEEDELEERKGRGREGQHTRTPDPRLREEKIRQIIRKSLKNIKERKKNG